MMIKKILVPISRSKRSKKILLSAIDIANKFSAELIILHAHVVSPELSHINEKSTSYLVYIKKILIDHHKLFLQEMKDEVKKQKIPVKTIFKEGKPGPIIFKTLKEEKCDLIVMGSNIMGLVRRCIFGSTSNYVFRHAKCSVFFVK